MKEVYIGNGKTITVKEREKVRVFDIPKLKKILKESKDCEIVAGMQSDWFWTAMTIKTEDDIKKLLKATCWDTPVVEINQTRQDCYVEVTGDVCGTLVNDGIERGILKIELFISGLHTKYISKMKFEDITKMAKEIEEVMKKYKNCIKEEKKKDAIKT